MYIFDQTRSQIFNMENITSITLNGSAVNVWTVTGSKGYLGVYDTEERAQEVFRKLAVDLFPERKSEPTGVYYMPRD